MADIIVFSLEWKECYWSAFLDVKQAFECRTYYLILTSYYPSDLKYKWESFSLIHYKAGVLEDSTPGPILYSVYIAQILINTDKVLFTYGDDTPKPSCGLHKPPEPSLLFGRMVIKMEVQSQ